MAGNRVEAGLHWATRGVRDKEYQPGREAETELVTLLWAGGPESSRLSSLNPHWAGEGACLQPSAPWAFSSPLPSGCGFASRAPRGPHFGPCLGAGARRPSGGETSGRLGGALGPLHDCGALLTPQQLVVLKQPFVAGYSVRAIREGQQAFEGDRGNTGPTRACVTQKAARYHGAAGRKTCSSYS